MASTRVNHSPGRPALDLVAYATLALASFAGWFAFVREGAPQLPESISPDTLAFLRSGFAQFQIALAALLLAMRLGPNRLRSIATPMFLVFSASWLVETIGVASGIPFGSYSYSSAIGQFLPGGTPWTIPLSWLTATLGFHLVVTILRPGAGFRPGRILATSFLLLAWDLSLDPAMSTINGFWTWAHDGAWYGVPVSNLVGWYLSGLAFAAILEAFRVERIARGTDLKWLGGFLALQAATPLAMVATEGMLPAALASLVVAAITLLAIGIRKTRTAVSELPSDSSQNLAFLAKNSRSFRFASAFLSDELQRIVAGVYGWCRVSDDLVDEARDATPQEIRVRLEAWEDLSKMAYRGRPCGIPLIDEVFSTMAERKVPFDYAHDLLEGLRMDIEPRRYRTGADLRTYSYRVASVIGVWLTRTTGIKDPWVLERAEALGHAMQLTNILRDVGDDLRMGRVYIPQQDLLEAGLTEDDLIAYENGQRPLDATWKTLVERLMDRADEDYRFAYEGMPHLPVSLRLAVAVAASVYRGIHDCIRANGYDNFRKRAVVGTPRKIVLAAGGLTLLARAHATRPSLEPALAQGK